MLVGRRFHLFALSLTAYAVHSELRYVGRRLELDVTMWRSVAL